MEGGGATLDWRRAARRGERVKAEGRRDGSGARAGKGRTWRRQRPS